MENMNVQEITLDSSTELSQEDQNFLKKFSSVQEYFKNSGNETEAVKLTLDLPDNELKEKFDFNDGDIIKLKERINAFNNDQQQPKNISPRTSASGYCTNFRSNYCFRLDYNMICNPCLPFGQLINCYNPCQIAPCFYNIGCFYQYSNPDMFTFFTSLSYLSSSILQQAISVFNCVRTYNYSVYISYTYNNPCSFCIRTC